jgi:N-acetylmuramic acid 6-phosphate (MurNAc-6-P) etherase
MLGRVKNGLMSEMVPRNEKLRLRKIEIDQALS